MSPPNPESGVLTSKIGERNRSRKAHRNQKRKESFGSGAPGASACVLRTAMKHEGRNLSSSRPSVHTSGASPIHATLELERLLGQGTSTSTVKPLIQGRGTGYSKTGKLSHHVK